MKSAPSHTCCNGRLATSACRLTHAKQCEQWGLAACRCGMSVLICYPCQAVSGRE